MFIIRELVGSVIYYPQLYIDKTLQVKIYHH